MNSKTCANCANLDKTDYCLHLVGEIPKNVQDKLMCAELEGEKDGWKHKQSS